MIGHYFTERRRARLKIYLDGKSKGVTTRLTLIRFFLTLFTCGVCLNLYGFAFKKLPLNLMAWGAVLILIFAVDISDAIWARVHQTVGKLVMVTIGLAAFGFIGGFVLFNAPATKETMRKRWNDFHREMNLKIKNKALTKKYLLTLTSGDNWQWNAQDEGFLIPQSFQQAQEFCESLGEGWSVVKKTQLTELSPPIKIPRSLFIWSHLGGSGRQLSPGKQGSSVGVSATETSRFFTLCFYSEQI